MNAKNEAVPHSYEAIPCRNSPQLLHPHSTALTGNMQHISEVPHAPAAPPVMNPSTMVPQWCTAITMPEKTPSSVMHQTKILVILLIVSCVVQFLLGIAMIFTQIYYTFFSGVPFWGPVSYLIAAGLTLSVRDKSSPCMVKASLALNILGAIISCLGGILACLDIVITYTGCPLYFTYLFNRCEGQNTGGTVVYAFFLITNLLLFSVSISIAVYGCQSLSPPPTVPQVFLVQNLLAPASSSVIPPPSIVITQSSPTPEVPEEDKSSSVP